MVSSSSLPVPGDVVVCKLWFDPEPILARVTAVTLSQTAVTRAGEWITSPCAHPITVQTLALYDARGKEYVFAIGLDECVGLAPFSVVLWI